MNQNFRGLKVVGVMFSLLLLGLLVVNYVVLGGAHVINLAPAPELAGQISQNLVTISNATKLPIEGTDFNLSDTHYFNNKQWVVTSITPLNNSFNAGLAVLSNQEGVYKIVLGPGSAFSKDETRTLPTEVANYLNQQGVVYESVVDQ